MTPATLALARALEIDWMPFWEVVNDSGTGKVYEFNRARFAESVIPALADLGYVVARRSVIEPMTDAAPTLAQQLAALELLELDASPAPWEWLHFDDAGEGEGDELQDGHGEYVASGFRDDFGDLTDGRLCAAARNALPDLLREIARLRAIEAAAGALDDFYENECETFDGTHDPNPRVGMTMTAAHGAQLDHLLEDDPQDVATAVNEAFSDPAVVSALAARDAERDAAIRDLADEWYEAAEKALTGIAALHGDLGPDRDGPWHNHEREWFRLEEACMKHRKALIARAAGTPEATSWDLRPLGECSGCGRDRRHANRCCPDCDCFPVTLAERTIARAAGEEPKEFFDRLDRDFPAPAPEGEGE